MPKIVPINSVNYSEYIYIYRSDSYNSSPLTGLSSSTNGLKFYYQKRKTIQILLTKKVRPKTTQLKKY